MRDFYSEIKELTNQKIPEIMPNRNRTNIQNLNQIFAKINAEEDGFTMAALEEWNSFIMTNSIEVDYKVSADGGFTMSMCRIGDYSVRGIKRDKKTGRTRFSRGVGEFDIQVDAYLITTAWHRYKLAVAKYGEDNVLPKHWQWDSTAMQCAHRCNKGRLGCIQPVHILLTDRKGNNAHSHLNCSNCIVCKCGTIVPRCKAPESDRCWNIEEADFCSHCKPHRFRVNQSFLHSPQRHSPRKHKTPSK